MENSDSQDVFTDAQPVPTRKCLEVLSQIPTEMKPNDQYYSMKSTDRGLAVIFSHESYDEIDGTKPAPRHGTSIDVDKLSRTFRGLGFEIDIQENKTYEEIRDHISQVSRMNELKKYDCLVVFVLTHGDESEIIYAKDRRYYVKELVEPFTGRNCIQLANKPKLFFIQACKGVKSQKGVTMRTMTDSGQVSGAKKTYVMYSIPEISDVLVSYATIEGYTALRVATSGTPYVKCLCEELNNYGTTEDLLTLLIRVHHRLSTSVYRLKGSNQLIKVQPSFLCYLNRFVRFDAPPFKPQKQ